MKKIKKRRKYRLDKHTKKVIKIGVITLASCYLISITFRTISSFILYNIENTKSIISLKEEVETLNTYNSMLFKEAGLLHNRVLTLENEIKELKDKWTPVAVCDPYATKKTYMDYRTITDSTSKQYKLINKGYSIDDHGQLTINDYKLVAMGFNGVEVGNKYHITFSSGTKLKVMIGDIKHQGCNSSDGSMLEMIVDTTKMNKDTLENNFDSLYEGMITKIEKEN